ncbi:GntR family transcriptional regulator [Tepidibacillus infernus]|uniref:GntR family transcriptional regulator n=1 Tax=Tepidibacillus decaturensis TaxID=1413211 RepID=A0A135L3L0_9BACI|nr:MULTISPECIES: GntR family transcriptional regulator [Tepidibacillus]KXG43443.1 GntR family transcriptional regulator [Tepidibacillus decaturensis]GBF11303.1 putative HTH-type transcriptional regulator YegW [Tepidibacillus sp. HK-1]
MSLRSDPRPLYLLVIDKIKQDIEQRILKPGQKLPSEFELSKDLGISRATLREALRILEDENIITRKHGVGTFINAKPVYTSGIEELFSITQMIEKNGQKAGTIYVNKAFASATQEDIKTFHLDDSDLVLRVERIRTADEEPVVYCIDKIPDSILTKDFDFHQYGSVFKSLEQHANIFISHAITEIIPIGYHEKISPLLHSPPESSLLILKQLHFDMSDRPVLFSINYFRADKFRFQVLRKR